MRRGGGAIPFGRVFRFGIKQFTVLHVDTKDYKFNRDEANER